MASFLLKINFCTKTKGYEMVSHIIMVKVSPILHLYSRCTQYNTSWIVHHCSKHYPEYSRDQQQHSINNQQHNVEPVPPEQGGWRVNGTDSCYTCTCMYNIISQKTQSYVQHCLFDYSIPISTHSTNYRSATFNSNQHSTYKGFSKTRNRKYISIKVTCCSCQHTVQTHSL